MSEIIRVGFIETQKTGFSVIREEAERYATEKGISVDAAAIMLALDMSENAANYCEHMRCEVAHIDDDFTRERIEVAAEAAGRQAADEFMITTDPDAKLKEAYLSDQGEHCPFCSHDDIHGDSVEIGAGTASQECHCPNCDGSFISEYSLSGISIISKPDLTPAD